MTNSARWDLALIHLDRPFPQARPLDLPTIGEQNNRWGARMTWLGYGDIVSGRRAPGLQARLVSTIDNDYCDVPAYVLCAYESVGGRKTSNDNGSLVVGRIDSLWHLFGVYSGHYWDSSERDFAITSVARLRGWIESRMIEYGY